MRFWLAIPLLSLVLTGCHRAASKPSSPDALVILRQTREAMIGLKSYSAVCFTTTILDNKSKPPSYTVSTLVAEKPAKMSYHNWAVASLPDPKLPLKKPSRESVTFVSDGTREVKHLDGVAPDTIIDPVDPSRLNTLLEPWNGFYVRTGSVLDDIDQARARGEVGDASYLNSEIIDGVACDKLLVHIVSTQAGTKSDETYTYLIGQADHLVRQLTTHVSFNDRPGLLRDAVLHNVNANPPIDEKAFRIALAKHDILKKPEL